MAMGMQVAIKKIPSAFDDVVDAKRIVREVRLLRRLDHMNIIKIVDILPPPSLADFNDVYIVSELMDTDLHRVIYSSQVRTINSSVVATINIIIISYMYEYALEKGMGTTPYRLWRPWRPLIFFAAFVHPGLPLVGF